MGTTCLYSLTNYILTISKEDGSDIFTGDTAFSTFNFGGTDSFVGQIRVQRPTDTWTTDADVTGSFVHNKNYNRSGRVQVSVKQVSADVTYLLKLANSYFVAGADDVALTITITDSRTQTEIVKAESCFLTKPADQAYGDRAQLQEWIFTCGAITYPAAG